MVRDPNTQLHRFGGVFTQKQHLWAALESLGMVQEDTVIFAGDEKKLKEATYRNLCEAVRVNDCGHMIVLRAAHDDKLAVISEVELNEAYAPGQVDVDEPETSDE
jgi:hypothetical protein